MSKAVQPLAYHGHDIMLFQLLDPQEMQPDWRESVLLEDVETQQDDQRRRRSISRASIGETLDAHLASLRKAAADVGAHQLLITTDEPLDRALRRYLLFREGRS